jgi:hypothetical protein
MKQGNPNWDPKGLSQEFLAKVEACERYLREAKAKLHITRSYQFVFDQTLAELHVFNSLQRGTFLASRDELLSGLKSLLELDVPKMPDVFDFERFKMVRRDIVESLIRRFEGDG